MSTFANRSNHSAVMSESDQDDDLEQNESVMHKVKDVVSKIFHPSFLFSSGGADSSRSKRKRTTSIENQGASGEEKTAETAPSNGHGTTSKSILQRRTVNDDEGQLTDDEDSSTRANLSPMEEDRPDAEQSKKRRRTANYQNVLSSNTNGNRSDEKHSPLNNSTNNVGTFSSRRILDYGTNHSTSVLPQPTTDSDSNAEGNQSASSTVKTRFNIPSLNRGLNSSYDPSQSPLFSVTSRPAETATTPARTTTNLKSTTNEFSANYLLASGLVQRSASTSSSVSSSTLTNPNSTHTQRLLSTERQMLGVNYASINSRRLPYIERLRRRTLQDCIRLNRTLDSEPLSISTIEEHTSAAASPIRKPTKTLEKDCGIQCNISNNDSLVEPSRKVQRTFPPPDIRNEALSVPNFDKGQSATTSQTESSIQTNSSISFEPIRPVQIDITKPKVLGNVTSFSWPKFARAQDEFAKKYPEKCRTDAIPTPAANKSSISSSTSEKSAQNATVSFASTAAFGSAASKGPLFGTSPPRATKPAAQPVWKCPSCSMEHPAQTSFCSVCKTRNTSYTRLSVLEPTATTTASTISKTVPDVVPSQPAVSAPSVTFAPITTISPTAAATTTTTTTTAAAAPPAVSITFPITTPPTLAFPPLATTKETTSVSFAPPVSAMPSLLTTPPSFFGTSAPSSTSTASAVSVPVTTKDNRVINPPATVTSAPMFGSFGTSNAAPSLSVSTTATTSTSNPFSLAPSTTTSTPSTFPSFGTLPSSTSSAPAATTTTTAAPATVLSFGATTAAATTTTTTAAPTTTSAAPTFSFGQFSAPAATTASTSISTDKTLFSFGTSASAPSLTSLATGPLSTLATPATTAAAAPASSTSTFAPNLFAFSAPSTSATTTSTNNPPASTPGGFAFSSPFPTASSTGLSATNPVASSAPSLFASSSNNIGGFNFQPSGAATTTTTSGSTSSGFGASGSLRPFAPPVVSSVSGGTANAPSAFGSTGGFGAPSTSAPSFSAFGSATSAPSFSFGSTNTNSTQGTGTAASGLATSGFAFGAPAAGSTAGTTTAPPTIPTFGSTPATFNFAASPNLSFGSAAPASGTGPFQFGASAAPSSTTPFQFGSSPSMTPAPANPLAPAGFGAGGENNPFSVADDGAGRRAPIKAKRRAKGN